MTAVKNKIPDVSNLVKKTYYDAKILDIESKYFTAADYNKFPSETLGAEIKQKELVDKFSIAGFINNADFHKKVTTSATNAELKAEQDKIIQAFDPSYFRGKSHFEDDVQFFAISRGARWG